LEIALLRHGQPAAISKALVSASQFSEWIASYNNAGVAESSVPSIAALEYARTCGVLVSSNLLRSVQSAEFLCVDNCQVSDNLFTEAGMPYANWRTFKLPPKFWAAFFRVFWYLGYSKNSESYTAACNRAELAAQKLVALAQTHQSVMLVGHAIFNRLVARELRSLGWSGPKNPGTSYWDVSIYVKS